MELTKSQSPIQLPADKLNLALRQAAEESGAAGAAIAFSTEGNLSCHASWGMAPPVGAGLDPESGITGMCFRTAEPQLCRDTEEDSRVDAEACRALGVRSVLVIPLRQQGAICGIVELFSPRPATFNESHIKLVVAITDRLMNPEESAELSEGEVDHDSEGADFRKIEPHFRLEKHSSWSRPAIAAALIAAGMVGYGTQLRRSESSVAPQAKNVTAPEPILKAPVPPPVHASIATDDVAHTEARIQGNFSAADLSVVQARAFSGDPNAAYELAERYADGAGVKRNYQQAMFWFNDAASKGNASAQWKLGLGYLKGVGVPQDNRQAAEWFLRAANQAHIGAQVALSELYFNGTGVPRDYVRAYTWAAIAAETTNEKSDSLKAMAARMSPEQLADAQRRVMMWWQHRARPMPR